jgi:hypothetical protein
LGQPLEVRLVNLNIIDSVDDPGIEVNFDDVQLTAAPAGSIPAASQWGVLAMLLLVAIAGTLLIRNHAAIQDGCPRR